MRPTLLCLLATSTLASFSMAQRLATLSGPLAAVVELQPPTAVLPAALPPVAAYPAVPALPVVPPVAPAFVANGDSTFNNMTGVHWLTNGLVMASMPTPTFPPLAPIIPAFPIPPAVLAAIGGGPVTGIAINPALGIMFLCGPILGGPVIGVAPVPGMPVLVPPFPIPFATGPITGLEWDGITGTLYAVDAVGICYNFFPGGLPAAAPIVPPIPLGGPAGDVAIDKSSFLNGVGLRSLYVVGGPMVIDVNTPAPLIFLPGVPAAVGLSYLDHPASVPSVGTCICPGTGYPTQATSSIMSAGNGAFSLSNGGLPPGFPVIFCFDTATSAPAFFPFAPSGCPLGLIPGSPTLILIAALAGAGGVATFALPLFFPIGAGPLYNQNVTFCPADPTGFVVSPFRVIFPGGL